MNYSPKAEVPARVVGRERKLTPSEALAWHSSMTLLIPKEILRHPRGVFRFKTYSELDAWKKKLHS